jgi:hypothetical protein
MERAKVGAAARLLVEAGEHDHLRAVARPSSRRSLFIMRRGFR